MSDSTPTDGGDEPQNSSTAGSSSAPASSTGGTLAKTGQALATAGGAAADLVRYGIVIARLSAASVAMWGLSERVRHTYRYVEDCAESVDRLADTAASLNVDADTVGEHRDAATVMRSVLEEAESMAEQCEEMSTLFQQTADAHQVDYGPVAAAANAMDVPMADRQFYANR